MSEREEGERSPSPAPVVKRVKSEDTPSPRSDNIIWVDLEMTGLSLETDHIMEMACIVTDRNLNVLEEGPNLIIHLEDAVLDGMGEWCTEQHGKTGLTQECRDSKLSCQEVEDQMLTFIKKYCPEGRCELAGNSIHCDRAFLRKEMPRFTAWLHHRIIDVSTIRNLGWRWYRNFENYKSDEPMVAHRALDDIKYSIDQLRFFRRTVFKSNYQYNNTLVALGQESEPPPPLDFNALLSRVEKRQRASSSGLRNGSEGITNGLEGTTNGLEDAKIGLEDAKIGLEDAKIGLEGVRAVSLFSENIESAPEGEGESSGSSSCSAVVKTLFNTETEGDPVSPASNPATEVG